MQLVETPMEETKLVIMWNLEFEPLAQTSSKSLSRKPRLLMKVLIEEMKPVVTRTFELEHRENFF